ncbi:MAG: hypothetical protein JWL64_1813 [Frankiales bacterium]|nr:hypothetical protein [Frankiales bacterium]
MTAYEVCFTDGRPPERVEAERWEQRGTALVFSRSTHVMNREREVVCRRLSATGVREVRLASVAG